MRDDTATLSMVYARRCLFGMVVMVTGMLTLIVTPAQAGPGVLSPERAGRYYLHQICPMNAAIDRLNDALPLRANNHWYLRDLKGRVFIRAKRAGGDLADAEHRTSRKLFNPPREWPSNVARLVTRLADGYAAEAVVFQSLSRAATPRRFLRTWDRLGNYDYLGRISSKIRARLDLPAPGRGC